MNMHGGDRVNAFQLRGREDYFLTSGFRKINSPGKGVENKVEKQSVSGGGHLCLPPRFSRSSLLFLHWNTDIDVDPLEEGIDGICVNCSS